MFLLIRMMLVISLIFNPVKYKDSTDKYLITSTPNNTKQKKQIFGTATYYSGRFHGRKTANGEIYNMHGISCATRDRTIPFGSKLKITNIETGKTITVIVNDRMAKQGKHTIDLSVGAFIKLAPKKQGVIKVKIEKL